MKRCSKHHRLGYAICPGCARDAQAKRRRDELTLEFVKWILRMPIDYWMAFAYDATD